MADYNQYNNGGNQYNQQWPQQQSQYPAQQPQHGQYNNPSPAPGQGYGGGYAPPAYDSTQQYGPPAHGGFQHGQQDNGASTQSYYGHGNQGSEMTQYNNTGYPPPQPYPSQQPAAQFPQQDAYNQAPYDANQQRQYGDQSNYGQQYGGYGQSDPSMQQEGDRGLMGAIGGGAAGYFGGKKLGGHTIIGTLAGAVLGSKLEDKAKQGKHGNHGQHGRY